MSLQNQISQFLSDKGISALQENDRSYIFDCPSCGGKKKLYIQKKDGISVCFKQKNESCPKPGSKPEVALAVLSSVSRQEVAAILYNENEQIKESISLEEIRQALNDDHMVPHTEELPEGTLPSDCVPIEAPYALEGLNYLTNRGLTPELLTQYDVLYSPFMRRVVFPIWMGNKLIGWQGRSIDKVEKHLRMYNMPGRWKAHSLMFFNNLKDSTFAIVAEGPVSAMKFYKAKHFVATMGKEISNTQLDLLRNSGINRVYLALDRDAANKLDTIRSKLSDRRNGNILECFTVPIPDHRDDFGDCTFDECILALTQAKKLSYNDINVAID